MDDGDINAYHERLVETLALGKLPEVQLCSSPKHSEQTPLRFAGITLISTLDHQEEREARCYQKLSDLCEKFAMRTAESLLWVSPSMYHVTGADLLSGDRYPQEENHEARAHLHTRIETLLRVAHIRALSSRVERLNTPRDRYWRLEGIALFQTAIVALFSPLEIDTYEALCRLRHEIYSDPDLLKLGIRQPHPLLLHVTLAYLVGDPQDEKVLMSLSQQMHNEVIKLRDQSNSARELMVKLNALHLYSFEDMTLFQPISDCSPFRI